MRLRLEGPQTFVYTGTMARVKSLIHYKPPYREETYCGLDPLQERTQGRTIKLTQARSKTTCPDCEGLPKT